MGFQFVGPWFCWNAGGAKKTGFVPIPSVGRAIHVCQLSLGTARHLGGLNAAGFDINSLFYPILGISLDPVCSTGCTSATGLAKVFLHPGCRSWSWGKLLGHGRSHMEFAGSEGKVYNPCWIFPYSIPYSPGLFPEPFSSGDWDVHPPLEVFSLVFASGA